MNNDKRRLIEGWIDKASNQLHVAQQHSKSYVHYSEAIQAAQECIELSVKSVLSILHITFSPSHGWNQDKKQFINIAEQIQKKRLIGKLEKQYLNHSINLPRLLFLVNFWSHFYITAKYGFEAGYLASAKDLFKKEEADLSIQHARECYDAASQLRYLDKDKLALLLTTKNKG